MKIDELMRDATLKLDQAAKGKVATDATSSAEVVVAVAESMPDSEFLFPDLLQSFAKLLTRRETLVELLPQAARSRLDQAVGSLSTNQLGQTEQGKSDSSGANPVSAALAQGISGLARENRVISETLRQMISELEFVERVPELTNLLDAVRVTSEGMAADRYSGEGVPVPQGQADTGSKLLSGQSASEVIKSAMTILQSIAEEMQIPPQTSVYLNRLAAQSAAAGRLAPDLAEWVDAVASALDGMSDDTKSPEFVAAMAKWIHQADPRILQLSRTTDRPELVRAWAAVQTLNELPQNAGQAERSQLELLRSVVQRITELPTLTAAGAPTGPVTPVSLVGRFELLLSTAATRPELMQKLLTMLPELIYADNLLPEAKVTPTAYQTLAQTAPQWLKKLAEREERPAVLQFWVAVKTADLEPWLRMEPLERQQLTAVLKELRSTFEQPEAFRTPREDSGSRSFMMQLPLYAPGLERPYPALIQVFEEKRERGGGQLPEQEIWVRISLATEHIGTVDLSFRLQEKKYLSIFSRFADPAAASEFRTALPELRKEMAGTSLELKKIAVAGRIRPGGQGDG